MAQSPISQIQVIKPNSTTPSPTNGSQRPATGPQNKAESSTFEFNDLRFPFNIATTDKGLHWIKFIPTVQNKSSYNVKKAQTSGLNTLSRADTNRLGGPQLSGREGYFDTALGAVGGAVGFGAALGAISAAEATAAAIKNPDPSDAFKIGGSAALGFLGGIAGGAIINAIDLTRKTRRAAGSISLYMPDTVNQTVVNDYDQVSLTQALGKSGLVLQAGGSLIKSIKERGVEGALPGGLGQTTGSAAASELAGALAEKSGAFGQGFTDVLLFSAGYAQNPQVELLFKTIQNREFLFDFKFAPHNKREAEEVIKIIQAFRFFAAPEIPATGNGRYFVPPSEFDIVFMVGSSRNTNLPQISTCVLQGIDVNYGSAGQWTAFKDGMPVEIAMQLRFKEVEIMHKELIKQGY